MSDKPPRDIARTGKLKLCNKCETLKPPEGGCNMRPGRWLCFTCWQKFNQRKKTP